MRFQLFCVYFFKNFLSRHGLHSGLDHPDQCARCELSCDCTPFPNGAPEKAKVNTTAGKFVSDITHTEGNIQGSNCGGDHAASRGDPRVLSQDQHPAAA